MTPNEETAEVGHDPSEANATPNDESNAPVLAERKTGRRDPSASVVWIDIGFATGLVLASVTLVFSAVFLFTFQGIAAYSIPSLLDKQSGDVALGINAQLAVIRLSLISCGVFVGLAFGFLGFSLFLIGIRDEMNFEGKSQDISVKIAKISPGTLILLASVVLISVCVTQDIEFRYSQASSPPSLNGLTPDPESEPENEAEEKEEEGEQAPDNPPRHPTGKNA